MPKFYGHHFCHIAAETINLFACPKEQNIAHFEPRIGRWVEVLMMAAGVIYAVIQFYGFVPIGYARIGRKTVVASGFGWIFYVVMHLKLRLQRRVGAVVKVILRIKMPIRSVVGTKITHIGWFRIGVVVTRHVVGYKIDEHFEFCFMRTRYQCFKFVHALFHIHCQIGIYVVVIFDSVRRTRLAFDHGTRVRFDASVCVVGLCGVFQNTCVPHVCDAQLSNRF